MSVVTITRQYGAGGSAVARLAAEKLGWTLIDNEFVQQVAARAHLPVATVAARQDPPSADGRLTVPVTAVVELAHASGATTRIDGGWLAR